MDVKDFCTSNKQDKIGDLLHLGAFSGKLIGLVSSFYLFFVFYSLIIKVNHNAQEYYPLTKLNCGVLICCC